MLLYFFYAHKEESELIRRLSRIEQKVDTIKTGEKTLEKEEKNVEKTEQAIQKEQQKMERTLFQLGKFTFKRKHVMELIRGTAGAFFGVGIGKNLLNLQDLSAKLPWWNVLGILLFVLLVSSLLIYKNEKDFIRKRGYFIVFRKLILLYLIAMVVELISLWLFKALPPEIAVIIKMLIIGSFAAMGGAVTFSIV